jgi:hypothetical protein
LKNDAGAGWGECYEPKQEDLKIVAMKKRESEGIGGVLLLLFPF